MTTLDDKIPPYIEKICKRDPFSGKVVTGGIITVKDSSWLMSYTLNRQPHFKEQPKDQLVVWVYGLFTDVPGDFIKKPMRECTGYEITQEWLYHLGVPEVFGSCYDIRVLLDSTTKMMDGKKLIDMKVPFMMNLVEKKALKAVRGTVIEELLQRYNVI